MTDKEYDRSVVESLFLVSRYIASDKKLSSFLRRIEEASDNGMLTEEDLDYIAAMSIVANDITSKWSKHISEQIQSN